MRASLRALFVRRARSLSREPSVRTDGQWVLQKKSRSPDRPGKTFECRCGDTTVAFRTRAERRVGYDFTFSVPKSVSLLYGRTGDHHILEAFRSSVNETMLEMEAEMKTRVRTGGQDENRVTGNMVWGEFIHTTSRPV